MCDTCGCTKCKCGGKVVNGVCDKCGKHPKDCDC